MPPELIGCSSALQRLRKKIPRLAMTHASILLLGEAGAGKTLFAEHVHASGPRQREPIQVINCLTTTERDLRLDLFGGGPPALPTPRRSTLEILSTLLIKHLDAAPAYIQNELAEILSNNRLKRQGEERVRPIQARLIFSLLKSPRKLLSAGKLTPPLYDCLAGLRTIRIPPLRKRKEDLPELLGKLGNNTPSPDLALAVDNHTWPGNITELKSLLRMIIVISPGEALREHEKREVARMLLQIEEGREFSLSESLELIELGIIRRTFARNDFHQSKTARMLGISDRNIRRKLGKIP